MHDGIGAGGAGGRGGQKNVLGIKPRHGDARKVFNYFLGIFDLHSKVWIEKFSCGIAGRGTTKARLHRNCVEKCNILSFSSI